MGCKLSREKNATTMAVPWDKNAKTTAIPWDTLDDLDTDFDPHAYVANILKAKNRRACKKNGEIYDLDSITSPKDFRKMRKGRTKQGKSYSDSDSNASHSRTVETIMVDLSEEQEDGFSSLLPPKIINFRAKEYGSNRHNDHKQRVSKRGKIHNSSKKPFKWGKIENIQPTFSDSKSSSSFEDHHDLISTLRRSRRALKANAGSETTEQSSFSPPKVQFESTCKAQSFFPGLEETAHIRTFMMFEDSDRQLSQSLL